MDRVWLQITSLSPLIPTVDVENSVGGRLPHQAFLGLFQGLAETLGRITADDMGKRVAEVSEPVLCVRSRGAVPAHRDIWVVRFRKILLHFVPVLEILITHLHEIGLLFRHLRVVDPNVGGHGIKPQLPDDTNGVDWRLLPRHDRLTPDHRVEMQIRKTGPTCLGTELIQRGPGVRQ